MKKIFIISSLILQIAIYAQGVSEKTINSQMQTWISMNTNTKVSKNWGVIADAHLRSNGFFDSGSFFLLRGGASYKLSPQVTFGGGYAHIWYPTNTYDWENSSEENRLFEQILWNGKLGKLNVSHRIRNEQRWQEKVVNGEIQEDIRFTNRVRYFVGLNIPVSENKNWPVLVLSDELMLHFGKEVVYNTFDQNRIFIGIKKNITPSLSFDFGYMHVYQQKYSGYNYDVNHTLRLFFYLNSGKK